jgi:hypothetical protein
MSHILKNSLLIGSGFATGVIAGYLIYPVSKKQRINELLNRAEAAIDGLNEKSLRLKLKGNESFQKFRSTVNRELRQPIPDLYKATESLSLDESDLVDV